MIKVVNNHVPAGASIQLVAHYAQNVARNWDRSRNLFIVYYSSDLNFITLKTMQAQDLTNSVTVGLEI